jgi:hypothetical protein
MPHIWEFKTLYFNNKTLLSKKHKLAYATIY